MNIILRRVYTHDAEPAGIRVLVDRLWPRGISKSAALWDVWLKDIAPSDKPSVGACCRGVLAAIRDLLRAASRPAASSPNALKTGCTFLATHHAQAPVWRLYRIMHAKQWRSFLKKMTILN